MTFKIQPNLDAGNKTENTCVEPSSKSTEREKEKANGNESSFQNIKQDRPRISVQQIKDDMAQARVVDEFLAGSPEERPSHNAMAKFRTVIDNEDEIEEK